MKAGRRTKMIDFIINMFADIAEIFVDLWVNKITDKFASKKKKERP